MSTNRPGQTPTLIDLFSGVGGFSLGAARAGFRVACAIDLDRHAMDAHEKNFPGTHHWRADITKITGQEIREKSRLDASPAGVIGGPPCQGFSTIGTNSPKDPRNQLFGNFFRLVSELKPAFFLAENVPGILNQRYSRLREGALQYVRDYRVLEPVVVEAEKYGAPTTRKRVFFFGYRSSRIGPFTAQDFMPPADVEVVNVRMALEGLMSSVSARWQTEEQSWRIARSGQSGYFAQRLGGVVPSGVGDPVAIRRLSQEGRASGFLGTKHSQEVVRRFAKVAQGTADSVSRCYRLDPAGHCPTIRAGTGSEKGSFQSVRPLHPRLNRVITPREAARLQGFPDWFQFSGTKWHSFRQIGNSVSPIVAERLLSRIREISGEGLSQ